MSEKWKIWKWDGRYLKGKLVKTYKSQNMALNYLDKSKFCDKLVKHTKNEFFIEDENGTPTGLLERIEK